jgi:hypothetical protein
MRLDEYERRETEKLKKFMASVEDMISGKCSPTGIAGKVVEEFLPMLKKKSNRDTSPQKKDEESLINDVLDQFKEVNSLK